MLPLDQNQTVDFGTFIGNYPFVAVLGVGFLVECTWMSLWRKAWSDFQNVPSAFGLALLASVVFRVSTAATVFIASLVALVTITVHRRKGDSAASWIAWMCFFVTCVAGLSNSSGSPGHLHEQLAAWLHITPDQAWHLVVGVRKTIHFSAYGLATLAAYRWSTANGAPGLWRGIAFTLPLACFDEFRQHFAAGREGSPWDVALDMAGAVTFLFIAWLIDRRRSASAAA